MAKKFKFEFERGGVLIADACEEEAPVTVKLFEEQCPRTMTLMHCVSACHEITTDAVSYTHLGASLSVPGADQNAPGNIGIGDGIDQPIQTHGK